MAVTFFLSHDVVAFISFTLLFPYSHAVAVDVVILPETIVGIILVGPVKIAMAVHAIARLFT